MQCMDSAFNVNTSSKGSSNEVYSSYICVLIYCSTKSTVTEGGNLRVWCITQNQQNEKRTLMDDLMNIKMQCMDTK